MIDFRGTSLYLRSTPLLAIAGRRISRLFLRLSPPKDCPSTSSVVCLLAATSLLFLYKTYIEDILRIYIYANKLLTTPILLNHLPQPISDLPSLKVPPQPSAAVPSAPICTLSASSCSQIHPRLTHTARCSYYRIYCCSSTCRTQRFFSNRPFQTSHLAHLALHPVYYPATG